MSFEAGGGENVPGIPGACTTRNFTYLLGGPSDEYQTTDFHFVIFCLLVYQNLKNLPLSFVYDASSLVDLFISLTAPLNIQYDTRIIYVFVCIPYRAWYNIKPRLKTSECCVNYWTSQQKRCTWPNDYMSVILFLMFNAFKCGLFSLFEQLKRVLLGDLKRKTRGLLFLFFISVCVYIYQCTTYSNISIKNTKI